MDEQQEQLEQLEVQGTPTPGGILDDVDGDLREQEELAAARAHVAEVADSKVGAELREREYADGDPVSDNVVGEWAVYDNSELRFWPGQPTFVDREAAERELDEIRPTTGHDLVVVQV